MKKFKSLIAILAVVLLLSGCVKTHTTMTIHADKKLDYETEILFASSLGDQATSTLDEEEYKKKGYTVTTVEENNYKGLKITKSFKNIDDMSNNKGEEVIISNFLNEDFNDKVVFKLEKGFFKNKYTAVFKYASANSLSNMDDSENPLDTTDATIDTVNEPEETEETTTTDDTTIGATTEEPTTTEETTTEEPTTTEETEEETTDTTDTTDDGTSTSDLSGLEDMVGLMGEMEFTYKVVLPVKASSNNATNVSSDGKTLTWNLAVDKESNIEFSFSLLNLMNIIIVGGGALLVIIIIVVVIIVMKKKKASKETLIHADYDPSIATNVSEGEAQTTVAPMQPVEPTQPAAPEVTPTVPQTDNLQFNLPAEDTQSQVNPAPQESQFVTPAVEDAVNSVTAENTDTQNPANPM